MESARVVANSVRYTVQVWAKFSDGRFKFGIQAVPLKGRIYPWSAWVSEEFVEDNIDNRKSIGYLEQVVLRLAENHLEDMINTSRHSVRGNLQRWLKEAKRDLEGG